MGLIVEHREIHRRDVVALAILDHPSNPGFPPYWHARGYGLYAVNNLGQNAFDPKQNIEGGVRHLRYLIDRYPGNLPLAIAAYNAGEGAVDRHRGIPPYAETQEYVRRVLQMSGGGGGQVIYRFEDAASGTVTYTNVPPARGLRVR